MPDILRERRVTTKTSNYSLLKTSWKYQTREFFENSTLHGVRYIAEKDRPMYERVMWFFFVITCTMVTMIIIISLWEKFQTNPTITGLDTDFHNWDVPFPAITICPQDPTDQQRVDRYITEKWGNTSEEEFAMYKTWITYIANFSYKNLETFPSGEIPQIDLSFRDLTYKIVTPCDDLFYNCTWKSTPVNCCNVLRPAFTEQGFCYSFNAIQSEALKGEKGTKSEFIYETDSSWMFGMEVKVPLSSLPDNPWRIYIHSSDELPVSFEPHHTYEGDVDKISFAARITYTTDDARQLTIKQRKCAFKDEMNLETAANYSYWACKSDCRMKNAMKSCQCVPHFHVDLRAQCAAGFCTNSIRPKRRFPYCDLQKLKCLSEKRDEVQSEVGCNCHLGCDNTMYEIEKLMDRSESPDKKDENNLEIGFVSWPMIRYKREVLFGWVDLLVAFGGIAGLFLGFSLLSGVELVYYFTLRAFCMLYKDRKKLEEIYWEEKKPKAPIDLSFNIIKNSNVESVTSVKRVGKNLGKKQEKVFVPYMN